MGIVQLFADITSNIIMRFTIALFVLSLACLASAYTEPKAAECSVEAASLCVTEIGAAWDACQDWTGPDQILGCMENIIGATDCWDCVCVVLSFLPFCA